ncbi:hypothetical protein HKX48_007623 [Thoreauomyces humboldtii]|nr:hypothetical protein HKX48_007623 [Thoreauomyces humboldtii]
MTVQQPPASLPGNPSSKSMWATVAQDRPSGGPYNLCYELHGSGPNKVLLVMGLSGTLRAWDSTVAELLARDAGYEVCIFDNRGVGHSTQPGAGYTVKDMAQDAYELLLHLGWTKDVYLAGVSMGGMISLELSLLAPQETFGALVLISTHAGNTIPPLSTIWTFGGILFGGQKSEKDMLDTYCNLVFALPWLDAEAPVGSGFPNNRAMVQHYLKLGILEKGQQSEKGRSGQFAAIRTHSVSNSRLKQIGHLGIPILVMTGTEDRLIRSKNSHHIAKQIGCPIEVFQSAGHGLASERPHRFHELLCETFAKSRGFVVVKGSGQGGDVADRIREADKTVTNASL